MAEAENTNKKRLQGRAFLAFGRGVFGNKDVPTRILDAVIALAITTCVFMVIWFATHSGYHITFNTNGGSEIEDQILKYGDLVQEPEDVIKPGYTLEGWVTSDDVSLAEDWDFDVSEVTNDQTLYAIWEPAEITVKFDLDGGNCNGSTFVEDKVVVYGEAYGDLPIPVKDGFLFDGWIYSGDMINSDTIVTMTGEHVLTARWIAEE